MPRSNFRKAYMLALCLAAMASMVLPACQKEAASPPQGDAAVEDAAVEAAEATTVKANLAFGGKIARSYADSEEWWPTPVTPPEGAPNVIIFLLDDTGFAQIGSFGGLIKTPNIDRLADGGLRYNNFHTTALCSPSRATLMAGRNPHAIGLGSHALTAMGFPGYNAMVPPSAKSVANYLEEQGYVNYALGKWDHTPLYEVSQVGPFDRWPSDEGFAHAYTFMAADVHQFIPVMWDDHHPEPYRKTEHLDKDLADRAIDWITGHKSIQPDLPFMMLWASGSMHSPHHAPDDYLNKYKGKFDEGWDVAREKILANQKQLGIVPDNTVLTNRIDQIPAWDSLSAKERKLYARQMEVFAAQLEFCDAQIGRVVEALERIGELDNTLIFVTSDNGASGEGGLAGTFNETYVLNGLQTPFDANIRHLDRWGQWDTYPHYHAGWAMAGNTPFRYFKQSEHRGGQHDALVVHWPNGIEAKGEIARDLKEMGIKVDNTMMQDKVGSFPTMELINYGYTVTQPDQSHLNPVQPWSDAEWRDRVQAIMGRPSPLGTSWMKRADEHMDWGQFVEFDGKPMPSGVSLEDMRGSCNPLVRDDPMRLAYSYGERFALNDQVMRVIRELRRNPQSRQLYVAMWDPQQDSERLGKRRVPCSIGWQFMMRNGKLHITYTMRSCDFVTHWQNDVWLSLQLLDFVCLKTGHNSGQFSQFINSFHVYESDVADVF